MNTIQIDVQSAVLTITLNRPEVRNAFNDILIGELSEVFHQDAQDPSIKVVLLKGNGKVFSAGGDLTWMQQAAKATVEQNFEDAKKLASLLEAMHKLPKPLVACVQGAALGGGMGLVSVCDYVIAENQTRFGFTEAKLGLIPATIGPFAIEKIGLSQARALFLTAEVFFAPKALEIGLIHEVVESDLALEERTRKLIGQILSLSPQAVRMAKKMISDFPHWPQDEWAIKTAHLLSQIRATDEGREGIAAFLEKRNPRW